MPNDSSVILSKAKHLSEISGAVKDLSDTPHRLLTGD